MNATIRPVLHGALLALSLLVGIAAQAAERFVEGEHYVALPVPVTTGSDDVVVTEFFSYGCIHCFNLDPYLEAWSEDLPAGVSFERVPAVFSRSWVLFAESYYVAKACGVLDTTHSAFFKAIHVDRVPFRSQQNVAAFYADLMADRGGEASCRTEEEFMAAFRSFGVSAAVQQAMGRGRAYQANGVPAMIIDGRFRTDGQMAGSSEGMLEVVDQVVARELARTTAAGADD